MLVDDVGEIIDRFTSELKDGSLNTAVNFNPSVVRSVSGIFVRGDDVDAQPFDVRHIDALQIEVFVKDDFRVQP